MGSDPAGIPVDEVASTGSTKLAVLLSMAMFVLVFDTSLMNVSISYVVHDLNATASGVQGTIALEALVSAAFILIGSKIGDLIGRKRAYVVGLLGYAAGALAMTIANSLVPVIIFWAVVGGLGAALLLPAMQSLIHGNFSGPMQRKAYALVGAAAAIAAAAPTSAYTLLCASPSKLPWISDCMAGRSREAPQPPRIAQKTMIATRLCDSAIASAPVA